MFEEHFVNNNKNWLSLEDASGVARVEPEFYRLEHRPLDKVQRVACSNATFDFDRSEFRLQAALEWLDGDQFSGYGLAWGVDDDQDFLEFLISPSGRFRVSRFRHGCHFELTPWTDSSTIRGVGLNILELRRIEADVFFLINSELVCVLSAVIAMEDLPGEHFGFSLSGRASVRAHFVTIGVDRSAPERRAGRKYHDSKLESTGVEIEVPANDSWEAVLKDMNALVGLQRVKREFIKLSQFVRVQSWRQNQGLARTQTSLHLVFSGAPGTGKTSFARLVGRLYASMGVLKKGHVLELGSADLIAGYTGQTTLKVQHAIEQALGGVLFIDEAYLFAGDHWYCEEAINVLVKSMEDHRDQLAVVLAGYPDEMRELIKQNPGLRSRFSRLFDFAPYSSLELIAIFDRLCLDQQYSISQEARAIIEVLLQVSSASAGRMFGNGRFVRNVFERLIEAQATRLILTGNPDREALQQITLDDVRYLEGMVQVAPHLN